MVKKKHRVVIYTKTVIIEETQRELFAQATETLELLEDAGRSQGWAESVIADDENVLPRFELPPESNA